MVANGGKMACHEKCQNIIIAMGDSTLQSNMMAIPIGGCDVEFGVQWLRTLRLINRDITKLSMQFSDEDNTP